MNLNGSADMKKEDKELIFDLLKKADSYVQGYTGNSFLNKPVFEDDIEVKAVAPVATAAPAATTSPAPGLTLDELNAKILRCTKCPLARTRNNVVPGEGVSNPEVLVIGEGPGYEEDMSGRPFVGKAGVLLDKMLNAIELDRKTNCFIANVVKCRPPENRDPEPSEQSACEGFLQAQIHILKPKMILCMGRIAGHKMLDTTVPLSEMRGSFHDYNGIPLMVTYHPSALLRDESLKKPAWEDLKAFKKKLIELTGK